MGVCCAGIRGWGREIDQGCLVEVEGKGLGLGDEEEREKKGLERIDRVDGGLTRRRWEMKEGEKEKEKEEKKIGDGVDDRSLTKDEMASSPGSDKPETIYVNIFDPVGREAFRPSLMKSIPEWMQSGAREHLDREAGSSLPVNLDHQKLREQMADRASTISTPRPISQGLSETSSTATPTASRAASTRRRSGAISPRATSPTPSIDAISRASSVRTGTSFVSEQPLVVPSMSSNHPKETTKGPAKDTRDSWLSTDSNVSSNPNTSSYNNNQPETLSRPSAVRSVATIFERGIASKDQRHTPVNQPLPLLRILQQPYRPLTPTRSDTSLSSSSPHLQPNNLATRPQRAQTHELGAASLPKPIQILRSGQAGKQSQINRMGSATVSIPVVSTSSEYLERYQPVKASTIFLSSSSPAQGARSSVRSIRAGGPGVSAITRGWEGQLSNTSSSGETERGDLAKRLPVYSTSQPPSSFVQSSYTKEGQTTSIRRSVSHSIRQEGALDEGQVRMGQSSPSETYTNGQGQITIRRSISHSLRREGAHDQGQSHHFTSQPQSPKPQSPTLPSRRLPYSSSPNSPPNGPNGPTAPIPLNFTVQKRFGGPTIGGSVVTASSITGTEGAASTSSESSPGMGTGTGTGTGEEKGGGGGGGSGLSRGNNWTRTRTPSAAGNATTSGTGTGSTPVMFGVVPVKTLSKRRSGVHAELKRLFGRQ
ncbi:hypothetical protein B0H65DRAFT_578370 [Neurospora tetraspora]|uniref:Uncharacterized protein n=1 Tax=Neurospora tetraspora TaxID=94610 RepID=A0AAE0MQW4_9PEZI|nr:hypothetical protein B0H65DRAFT_578370 [Neurospora tetraspora]